MKYIYVLVYTQDRSIISDAKFFNSAEEAIVWKKKQIADGNCWNPISNYDVKCLEAGDIHN